VNKKKQKNFKQLQKGIADEHGLTAIALSQNGQSSFCFFFFQEKEDSFFPAFPPPSLFRRAPGSASYRSCAIFRPLF